MADKRIIGAVGVGNATFTAGEEAEFEAAAKAAGVDMARLESKGVISGFSGKKEKIEAEEPALEKKVSAPAAKKSSRKK
jgi:hypothetical protein